MTLKITPSLIKSAIAEYMDKTTPKTVDIYDTDGMLLLSTNEDSIELFKWLESKMLGHYRDGGYVVVDGRACHIIAELEHQLKECFF